MNKDSWEILKLGQICEIISGSTPKTNVNEYWNGKYNWVTPAELNGELDTIYDTQRKITAKAIKETNLKLLPKGAILLSSRAPIGKVAIAGNDMYSNQGFKNLICSKKIYNRYLFRFLKGKTEYLNSLGRGATFKEISKEIVSNIPIPIPPISLQEQIVKELDTLSDIINKKKEQLAELDKLAQATFYDMFGDPIKNEKRWVNKKLSEVCHFVGGGTPPKANQNYYQGAIPWATVRDMSSFYLKNTEFKINEEAIKKSATNIIPKGSIIIATRVGLGKVCLLKQDTAINQDLKGVIPNEELNNIYLGYWFKEMADEIIANGEGATVKGVTLKFIHNLNIFLPPILFQTQFAEKIEAIEQQKALINQSITDTQLLFDYTMDKYFN